MRPKIICHMMSAIDGRLVSNHWSKLPTPLSSEELVELYDKVAERFNAQGIMVGRNTMQEVLQIDSKNLTPQLLSNQCPIGMIIS